MSAKLTAHELDVWQRLQTITETLRREVGRGLREDADLSESEFTVLAHLAHAGGSARPKECARSIGWDSSRLAHQLGRLERRQLVVRVADERDGRGQRIELTDVGRAAHRRAVGPHLRAAKRWFADGLDASQLAALGDAISSLEKHIAALVAGASAGAR